MAMRVAALMEHHRLRLYCGSNSRHFLFRLGDGGPSKLDVDVLVFLFWFSEFVKRVGALSLGLRRRSPEMHARVSQSLFPETTCLAV